MTGATERLTQLVASADRAGWDAHRIGRPDLRDLHWRYRDAITRALHDEGVLHDEHRTRRSTP